MGFEAALILKGFDAHHLVFLHEQSLLLSSFIAYVTSYNRYNRIARWVDGSEDLTSLFTIMSSVPTNVVLFIAVVAPWYVMSQAPISSGGRDCVATCRFSSLLGNNEEM